MLRFELTFDAHRSLAQYRGRTGRMPDDLDHEVIDSPQALFRHLYEAHGLVEALDLDPATAPLQFWLRKHAELERSTARAVVQDRMATVPDRPPASGRHLLPRRSTAEGGSVGLSLGTPTAALATPPPAGGGARSRGPANPGATTGQGSGPRFRPFADPLVEAVAAAGHRAIGASGGASRGASAGARDLGGAATGGAGCGAGAGRGLHGDRGRAPGAAPLAPRWPAGARRTAADHTAGGFPAGERPAVAAGAGRRLHDPRRRAPAPPRRPSALNPPPPRAPDHLATTCSGRPGRVVEHEG